jgi:hypothetical protein
MGAQNGEKSILAGARQSQALWLLLGGRETCRNLLQFAQPPSLTVSQISISVPSCDWSGAARATR